MVLASCVKVDVVLKIDFCTAEKPKNRPGIEQQRMSFSEKDEKAYKRGKWHKLTSFHLAFPLVEISLRNIKYSADDLRTGVMNRPRIG
jgi:hypothetical protein